MCTNRLVEAAAVEGLVPRRPAGAGAPAGGPAQPAPVVRRLYFGDTSPNPTKIQYMAIIVEDSIRKSLTLDNVTFKWIKTNHQRIQTRRLRILLS